MTVKGTCEAPEIIAGELRNVAVMCRGKGNRMKPEATSQEASVDAEEDYSFAKLLGTRVQQVNGREYTSRFSGKGWITSDSDEGSFLSDMTFTAAHHAIIRA